MNKKWLFACIFAICIIIVFIIVRSKTTTNNPKADIVSNKKITQVSEPIEKEIKKVLSEVETDFVNGKKSYAGYNRRDFYNKLRMSKKMESASIEFVGLKDIDLDKVFNLKGKKVSDLTLENKEKLKELDNNLVNIDETNSFENEKYYLLRAEIYEENVNLYYLVQFSNNGASNVKFIFFTEDEEIIDHIEESVYEDDLIIE